MNLVLLAIAAACLCLLLWWLLVETEGVYLGSRIVIALYDLYARRYDRIKAFDERADLALLSQPLLDRLEDCAAPLALDVATGTGRLPLALARNGRFRGHVIGIDLSRRMLDVAREKVAAEHFEAFITLERQDAMRLPYPDAHFDAVTCLEALEFLPSPEAALLEMSRVLKPGGALLVTLRIDTRWMPRQVFSRERMLDILDSAGMADPHFERWQSDYVKVWARKSPVSDAATRGESRHTHHAGLC